MKSSLTPEVELTETDNKMNVTIPTESDFTSAALTRSIHAVLSHRNFGSWVSLSETLSDGLCSVIEKYDNKKAKKEYENVSKCIVEIQKGQAFYADIDEEDVIYLKHRQQIVKSCEVLMIMYTHWIHWSLYARFGSKVASMLNISAEAKVFGKSVSDKLSSMADNIEKGFVHQKQIVAIKNMCFGTRNWINEQMQKGGPIPEPWKDVYHHLTCPRSYFEDYSLLHDLKVTVGLSV